MKRISSFKPVIGKSPTVLILGTMPGIRSLEKKQYYGHSNNAFWRIIYSLLSKGGEPAVGYEDRKRFLKAHSIALWDVLKTCERRHNSSDTNIKHERQNDISRFLKRHRSIKAVFFNGSKALQYYNKYFDTGIISAKFIQLPSTSPANTMKFQKKLEQWAVIKKIVR